MERFRSLTALTVAFCALLAAAGGMALANGDLSAAKKKKHADKKADTKLFKKLLKKAAPNLTVKQAATATNATNATNATHAANADTVGGMKVVKIFYASAPTATVTTLLDSNGLQLTAKCIATNQPGGGTDALGKYTGNGKATMSTEGVTDFNTGAANSGGFMAQETSLNNGDTFSIPDYNDDTTEAGEKVGSREQSAGTFTYADSGGNGASLTWHSTENHFPGSVLNSCLFHGVANVG
jgi:hypothetical protein